MRGTITALRFQRRSKDWVNVYIDGRFAFALPAVEAAHLRLGQEVSPEERKRLERVANEAKVYDRVLRFLSYRPRSEAEVRRFLQRHRVDERVADSVIDRLYRAGYLDDTAFARFWVENRQQFNPRGIYALRQELRLKGVASDVIEAVLNDSAIDEEAVAYRILSAKVRRWGALERSAFWRRGRGYLARRGFSYEVIEAVLSRLWQQCQGDEDDVEGK
ncbi:MAG: RecX family transcriptional regulator [Anaerolineae bacterium]|nr:RecX family transcriptional regulator [Anaerolineae bacterium]